MLETERFVHVEDDLGGTLEKQHANPSEKEEPPCDYRVALGASHDMGSAGLQAQKSPVEENYLKRERRDLNP